jgi:hypothetical protein
MAGTYEVTFGQGFGTTRMGQYMPMWFELGIPDPGSLMSPMTVMRDTHRLVSAFGCKRAYGATHTHIHTLT